MIPTCARLLIGLCFGLLCSEAFAEPPAFFEVVCACVADALVRVGGAEYACSLHVEKRQSGKHKESMTSTMRISRTWERIRVALVEPLQLLQIDL